MRIYHMIKHGIAAALAAAILLPLAACGPQAQPPGPEPERTRYEATFLTLFDTVTTIVGYAQEKEAFAEQARFIHDELEVYHQLYDIYNDYPGVNNIKTINEQAGAAPVVVDRRIIDLLLEAREMYDRTGGKVNVAFGSVLSIWHAYREAGIDDPAGARLPPMDALREAARHTGIGGVIIDEAASTVYLSDPEMSLDVGAIAKGYATQQVCAAARERGITSLLVSVGGNVCAIGSQDGRGTPWKVGVQDPVDRESGQYLQVLGLVDETLVTSGSYQRYYTVDGKTYHHIIDPDTLMPADYFTAVTVRSTDSGVADALSTALFNLPYEEGKALVDAMEGTEAMWVLRDGTQRFTDGFLTGART